MKRILPLLLLVNVCLAQNDSIYNYLISTDHKETSEYLTKLKTQRQLSEKEYLIYIKANLELIDYKKALDVAKEGTSTYPGSSDIQYYKALSLYKYEAFESANTEINALLKQDSTNLKYLRLALKISNKQNKQKQYFNYLNKLYRIDSTNSSINYLLGKACIKQRQNNLAITYLNNTIKYDSTHAKAYKWLGKIYDARKMWDTSLYYTNKALHLKPNNASFLKQRASTHYSRNHYFRAKWDYLKLLKDSSDFEVVFRLGVCYQETKSLKEAHQLFLKAYDMDSMSYKTNQYLGISYQRRGNTQKAIYYLERAIAIQQPDNFIMRMLMRQLAVNYYDNKDYDKAIPLFKEIVIYEPRYLLPQFYLAECYYHTKRYKLAQKYYIKINGKVTYREQQVINSRLQSLKETLFFESKEKS